MAGGGKSYICLTKFLGCLDDPNFRGTIFRKTAPQLQANGGLVDTSYQIYPSFGGVYKAQQKKWIFKSKAVIAFAALNDDRDLPNWQGSQLTNVLVDEAAEFTEKQILFLLSRMRSATYKGKLQMILSANPDINSYLFEWVKPLLDPDTGIPKPGTENIVRWFVNAEGKLRWGDSVEELYDKWGKGKTLGEDFIPKSFKFVPLTVWDNKPLLQNNPEYLANLLSMGRVEQDRFLRGSWTARPDSIGSYWKRKWCKVIYPNEVPLDCTYVRAYDFAGTEPSEALPNPDYTASVKLGKSKSTGEYFIVDVTRFRKRTADVLQEVIATAREDGIDNCTVVIPCDLAAAGKFANSYFIKTLAEAGIPAKSEVISGHANKLTKFLPFASICEGGLVKCVKADWNEDFFLELEQFAGGSRKLKDDQVDAAASAFKQLAKQNTLPVFSLNMPEWSKSSPLT